MIDKTCVDCGKPAVHLIADEPYCRSCAWAELGRQPDDDTDSEPPGAGADPYGRPDPQTEPGAWRE
jgi:hypothetical protein